MTQKTITSPPPLTEEQVYNSLTLKKVQLEDDLKTITHIYGKVTSSHDYKEFARKTNELRVKVESQVKEVAAKIAQWDAHFKSQQAYQEMIAFENSINALAEKYGNS